MVGSQKSNQYLCVPSLLTGDLFSSQAFKEGDLDRLIHPQDSKGNGFSESSLYCETTLYLTKIF